METVQRKKSAHCDTLTPGQNAEVSDDERFSRLAPYELAWQSRQPFLQSRGYTLRPRYRPGWIPSWRGTGVHPSDCEDGTVFGVRVEHVERGHSGIVSLQSTKAYANVIDATRIADGKLVSVKIVRSGGLEVQIASILRTSPLDDDPTNHCVPILDIFQDDKDVTATYMVMPFLRDYDNPRFERVEDVLDFGEQLLEVSIRVVSIRSRLS